MAQPNAPKTNSPSKADYRTVDPFHAFAVIGESVRKLLVRMKIVKPKAVKKTGKAPAKASKRRH